MSNKTRRRSTKKAHARTKMQNRPGTGPTRGASTPDRELILGEIMGALLNVVTLGALASDE